MSNNFHEDSDLPILEDKFSSKNYKKKNLKYEEESSSLYENDSK